MCSFLVVCLSVVCDGGMSWSYSIVYFNTKREGHAYKQTDRTLVLL